MKQLIITLNLFLLFFCCTVSLKSQNLKLHSIPFPLEIKNTPTACQILGDSVIELSAAGKTNLFTSPSGYYNVQNAPMLLFMPDSDFTFTAKLSGELKAVYDVAALVIYQDSSHWAKFCFENSVNLQPTIVSVVTKNYSDDCNSMPINNNFAYMTVIKKGLEVSFHYSADGKIWQMVRDFRLMSDKDIRIGFAVHGSRGNGFSARFSQIEYSSTTPNDLRTMKK